MQCSLPLCCAVPWHTMACCAVPCEWASGAALPPIQLVPRPLFHNPQPDNSAHEDGNMRLCFLDAVCHALQAKAKVNVGFWGGITPDNAHKHDVLWAMLQVWHL